MFFKNDRNGYFEVNNRVNSSGLRIKLLILFGVANVFRAVQNYSTMS